MQWSFSGSLFRTGSGTGVRLMVFNQELLLLLERTLEFSQRENLLYPRPARESGADARRNVHFPEPSRGAVVA